MCMRNQHTDAQIAFDRRLGIRSGHMTEHKGMFFLHISLEVDTQEDGDSVSIGDPTFVFVPPCLL